MIPFNTLHYTSNTHSVPFSKTPFFAAIKQDPRKETPNNRCALGPRSDNPSTNQVSRRARTTLPFPPNLPEPGSLFSSLCLLIHRERAERSPSESSPKRNWLIKSAGGKARTIVSLPHRHFTARVADRGCRSSGVLHWLRAGTWGFSDWPVILLVSLVSRVCVMWKWFLCCEDYRCCCCCRWWSPDEYGTFDRCAVLPGKRWVLLICVLSVVLTVLSIYVVFWITSELLPHLIKGLQI